jgi:hypothetical protein
MKPLTWVLLAFPIYLFIKGRGVAYLKLAGSSQTGAEE